MNGRKITLNLPCLTLAAALAVLAAPTIEANGATSVRASATTGVRPQGQASTAKPSPQQLSRNELRLKQSTGSYFWAAAAVIAGVLVGSFVLGLWGDVALGGLIFGVELLASGAALTARKARACARNAFARNPALATPTSEAPTGGAQAYAGRPRGTRP